MLHWANTLSWLTTSKFLFFLLNGASLVSAGFTYRLDRLKPRASTFRGPPAKEYNSFNTVIGHSSLCSHSVLYFLNNPSVIFLTQLHSISEYYRILNILHYLPLYWNWSNTPHLPPVVKIGNWEGPHKWNSLWPLFI
jgi:hypothetical protein